MGKKRKEKDDEYYLCMYTIHTVCIHKCAHMQLRVVYVRIIEYIIINVGILMKTSKTGNIYDRGVSKKWYCPHSYLHLFSHDQGIAQYYKESSCEVKGAYIVFVFLYYPILFFYSLFNETTN